jgi:hypothetical protein
LAVQTKAAKPVEFDTDDPIDPPSLKNQTVTDGTGFPELSFTCEAKIVGIVP